MASSQLCPAYAQFFKHHVSTIAANLQTWNSAANASDRNHAVRDLHGSLVGCSGIFKAGGYFIKRCLEIFVLAGIREIAGFSSEAADLDYIGGRVADWARHS